VSYQVGRVDCYYKLEAGLVGRVVSIDKDFDAEVNWKGLGKKWLLSKNLGQLGIGDMPLVGDFVRINETITYHYPCDLRRVTRLRLV